MQVEVDNDEARVDGLPSIHPRTLDFPYFLPHQASTPDPYLIPSQQEGHSAIVSFFIFICVIHTDQPSRAVFTRDDRAEGGLRCSISEEVNGLFFVLTSSVGQVGS